MKNINGSHKTLGKNTFSMLRKNYNNVAHFVSHPCETKEVTSRQPPPPAEAGCLRSGQRMCVEMRMYATIPPDLALRVYHVPSSKLSPLLKLTVAKVAQVHAYTKNTELCILSGQGVWHVNYE